MPWLSSRCCECALPGILHSVFFWGFCLLTLGTAVIFLQADIVGPSFDVHFLKGTFYRLFSLVLDVAGLAAVLALGGFLVRRFLFRPKGLETIKDDYLIHAILFVILITGFVIEGVRMAATEIPTNPSLAHFSPVGYLVGRLFDGYTPAQLAPVHTSLWWVHMVLAMGFIALIPFTKLRHIFTGAAQYLLVDLAPKGTIATIDLEDESVDQLRRGEGRRTSPGRTSSTPMPARAASAARTDVRPGPRTSLFRR